MCLTTTSASAQSAHSSGPTSESAARRRRRYHPRRHCHLDSSALVISGTEANITTTSSKSNNSERCCLDDTANTSVITTLLPSHPSTTANSCGRSLLSGVGDTISGSSVVGGDCDWLNWTIISAAAKKCPRNRRRRFKASNHSTGHMGVSALLVLSSCQTAKAEIIKPLGEWICNYCAMGE